MLPFFLFFSMHGDVNCAALFYFFSMRGDVNCAPLVLILPLLFFFTQHCLTALARAREIACALSVSDSVYSDLILSANVCVCVRTCVRACVCVCVCV